jgi:hypothetical protein
MPKSTQTDTTCPSQADPPAAMENYAATEFEAIAGVVDALGPGETWLSRAPDHWLTLRLVVAVLEKSRPN